MSKPAKSPRPKRGSTEGGKTPLRFAAAGPKRAAGDERSGGAVKPVRSKEELRRLAEQRLRSGGPRPAARETDARLARLVQELEVHEVELELQNEELRQTQADLESLLIRFSELYEFSPVGYLTLDRDGFIRQANLEAARLLGVHRSLLEGLHLRGFLAAPERDGFVEFLSLAFTSCVKESRKVMLIRNGQDPVAARIDFLADEDGQTGRVVLIDLS
jgi:PAS domain S-box-containing protein